MAQMSNRRASLALAWGFLLILVTASWAGADDGVPSVAVRVQGAWLNYRDDNPLHTGEGSLETRLDFGSAAGVEAGVELRPWRLLGIEIATAYVPFEVRETDFFHGNELTVEKSSSRFHFRSLSVGLDFHIPAGKRVDIYLGPTHSRLIYGGRNHFGRGDDLDPHDAFFGAVVGVDVKPGTGPFAFTASVRYFRSPLSGQLVGGPQTYIDVCLVGAGLSYRF
jgi:hypothetical protein